MSEDSSLKRTVTTNFIWSFVSRWGSQLISFVVSIVLARILEPEMYGTVALVTVFTAVLSVFIDSGFGSALVQKKEADDVDFSTVFFFNIFVSLLLYAVMFFAAQPIADFYGIQELVLIVRVTSIGLIIAGIKNILISYIQRNLLYRKFFYSTLASIIGSGTAGISLALLGFGVWALVAQGLTMVIVDTVVLWAIVPWRPKMVFSLERLKGLFSFGWKILATCLVDKVYDNLRQLLIGKLYSATDLAMFDKAKGWPNLLFVNFSGAVDSVMYPVMARSQDDLARVTEVMRKTIKLNAFIVFPLLVALSVCAEPLIRLVLTEKWVPCAPYMVIICIVYMASSVQNTDMNMIRSIGRSDMFLALEIVKKVVDLILLIAVLNVSVFAVAASWAVSSIIAQLVTFVFVKKLVGLSVVEQIKDLVPSLLLCAAMGVPVYLLSLIGLPDILTLLAQAIVGVVIYLGLAKLFKVESLAQALEMLSTLRGKKGKGSK